MASTHSSQYSEPRWWANQHTLAWQQAFVSLRADFDRRAAERSRDLLKHQGVDDSVHQRHPVTPRNVGVEQAQAVPDADWELGAWEQVEPAVRYGVGARAQYPKHERWSSELEAQLRSDWSETNQESSWEKVKHAVRRGFEFASGGGRGN